MDIKGEVSSIVEKYLFKPNTEETINNIISEVTSYLNDKVHDEIIESYGQIEVRMRDKDTIFLNITPEIKYKSRYIKYIYTGETIDKTMYGLVHGKIYDVKCDILTLEPQSIKFYTGYRLPQPQSGQLGKELFKKMFDEGYFIEASKYRDNRINDILEN
jgi:hypothetical protein